MLAKYIIKHDATKLRMASELREMIDDLESIYKEDFDNLLKNHFQVTRQDLENLNFDKKVFDKFIEFYSKEKNGRFNEPNSYYDEKNSGFTILN